MMSQRTAMAIGVVRQAVNTSAGYCGFIGRISLPRHDASTMVELSAAGTFGCMEVAEAEGEGE